MTGIPRERRVSRRARRSLRLRVFARDDVRVVRAHFSVDGRRIRVDRRAPFTATWRSWRARPGVHRIAVRVWDRAGNSARVTRLIRVTR